MEKDGRGPVQGAGCDSRVLQLTKHLPICVREGPNYKKNQCDNDFDTVKYARP
jgi:hypothetical protein